LLQHHTWLMAAKIGASNEGKLAMKFLSDLETMCRLD